MTIEFYHKLAEKAIELRKLQKVYFKTRNLSILAAAKRTEKDFDEMLVLHRKPDLFNQLTNQKHDR